MKKERGVQYYDNLECELKFAEANTYLRLAIENHTYTLPKRLRTCTAWVHDVEKFYILESYDTYVAVIEKATGKCYDVLRWKYGYTATSAQHINKFRKDYGANVCITWRNV